MNAQLELLTKEVEKTQEPETLKKLNVYPYFKNLIPSLSDEEYQLLKQDLKKKGCLSPIITWNDSIVDGHNRYQICSELELHFDVKQIEFDDRDEAKIWIIKNQFGRRNLRPFQRLELASCMEDVIAKQAKENQSAGGGSVHQTSGKPVNTAKEMAKIADVSHDTYSKGKKIINEADEEDKEKLRLGNTSINAVYEKLKKKEVDQKVPESTSASISNEKLIQHSVEKIADGVSEILKIKDDIPELYKIQLNTSLEDLKIIVDYDEISEIEEAG